MMKSMKSMMMGGAILLGLTMCLTSCDPYLDDIFGEWSRPTGNNGNTKTTVAVKSVTLDLTTLTKAVGDDAVTLTATVDPSDASDKTVTWKSSDASIAAVDANGKVTFVAAGSTTITATATNGTEDAADDKTATCEVTISAKKVNVESVKLDQPTLTATVGDAAVTLTAMVTPDDATDKTVKWTSSNESVATVADGVVTFVAAGTATITATAPNGTDDTADDKTAECAVTVNAAAVPVTSVKLDKTELALTVGDAAVQLTATVAPDNASVKSVTWTSDKTSVATVDETGKVTAVAAGTATITAFANDESGKSATCTVTVAKKAGSISYTTTAVNKTVGDDAFTNTLTKTGDGTVSYASSKTSVATVNADGQVTIVSAGETTITATVTDSDTYSYATKTATYTVTVAASGPLTKLNDYQWNTPDEE